MNNILLEDIKNSLDKDCIVVIDNKNKDLKLNIKENIRVLLLVTNSSLKLNLNIENNITFNIFSYNSSFDIKLNILKDNLNINYGFSTINYDKNSYVIDINHLGNNIKNSIKNHGINIDNNALDFIINTIVPKDKKSIVTSQDSKIINLKENVSIVKPNLYIDNDDIEANHSSYIGSFKDEKLFYLMSRGLNKESAIDLLVKSFLIGNMDINFNEKEKILEIIKRYWR